MNLIDAWFLNSVIQISVVLLVGSVAIYSVRQPARRVRLGELTMVACLLVLMLSPIFASKQIPWSVDFTLFTDETASTTPARVVGAVLQEPATPRPPESVSADGSSFAYTRQLNTADQVVTEGSKVGPTVIQQAHQRSAGYWGIALRTFETCYLATSVAILSWLLVGNMRLVRLTRRARDPDAATQRLWRALTNGRQSGARLLVSERVSRPLSFGLFQPVVLIPKQLLRPDLRKRLEAVLLHELTHVERRDARAVLLCAVAGAFAFYQPLFWIIRRQLLLCQEYIADASAVDGATSAREYARFLLSIADEAQDTTPVAVQAVGVFQRRSELYWRIKMLVQSDFEVVRRTSRSWNTVTSVVVCLFAIAVSGLSFTTVRSEVESRGGDRTSPQDLDERYESSGIWRVLRAPNSMGLFHGLPQRLEQLNSPEDKSRLLAWQGIEGGGTLHVKLDVDLGTSQQAKQEEVVLGLFADPRWWVAPPVQIRKLNGAGTHRITGLPRGKYYLGGMIGSMARPIALGVHREWPEPIDLSDGRAGLAHVLVSSEFDWHDRVTAKRNYLGDWPKMDPSRLVSVRTVDESGKPVPFCLVTFRQGGFSSFGSDHHGLVYRDDLTNPFSLSVRSADFDPNTLAERWQYLSPQETYDPRGHHNIEVTIEPFPVGTGSFAGTVHNQYGEPLTEYHLNVLSQAGGNHSFGMRIPVVSESGAFEVTQLRPGTYTVSASAFDYDTHVYQRGGDRLQVTIPNASETPIAVNIELEARNLWYGQAQFDDGSPVSEGSWSGIHDSRVFSMNINRDGTFRVTATEAEKADLEKHSAGMIEVSTHGDNVTRARIHIDELSKDPQMPTIVTLERPGTRFDAPTAQVPDDPLAVASLEQSGAGVEKAADGTARKVWFMDIQARAEDLAQLKGLPHVEEVSFIRTKVTAAALAHLKSLPRLKSLKLRSVSDEGAVQIGDIQSLKSLDLTYANITDKGLLALCRLKGLRQLNLYGTKVTSAGVQSLTSLHDLRELDLSTSTVDDTAISAVSALTKLETLKLGGAGLTDQATTSLAKLPNLRDLGLARTHLTDASAPNLAKLTKLERLDLQNTRLSDAGVAELTTLGQLRHLELGSTQVGDEGVRNLVRLSKLESLGLGDSRITDAALVDIGRMRNLKQLAVSPNITDAGLVQIGKLTRLETLWLSGCQITDAGLVHLKPLKQLRNLGLTDTPITDAGVVHLSSMSNLYFADFNGTSITEEGKQQLWELPRLQQLFGP